MKICTIFHKISVIIPEYVGQPDVLYMHAYNLKISPWLWETLSLPVWSESGTKISSISVSEALIP